MKCLICLLFCIRQYFRMFWHYQNEMAQHHGNRTFLWLCLTGKLVLLLIANENIFWDVNIFPEIHEFSFLENFYFISLNLGEILAFKLPLLVESKQKIKTGLGPGNSWVWLLVWSLLMGHVESFVTFSPTRERERHWLFRSSSEGTERGMALPKKQFWGKTQFKSTAWP